MVGPVAYEASVPFFIKALESQLKLLQYGKDWCKENGHEESKLLTATLATDMSVSIYDFSLKFQARIDNV